MILLLLESNAACTSLKVTLHEKVQCWFSNDASKPEVIEKNICEGSDYLNLALQPDITSLQVMVPQQEVLTGVAIKQ